MSSRKTTIITGCISISSPIVVKKCAVCSFFIEGCEQFRKENNYIRTRKIKE